MKIAIIGAMDKEIAHLIDNIKNLKSKQTLQHTFYEGEIHHHEVVVVKAGIGKVASGILISALCQHYPYLELIINIGVSGGVANRVSAGEVVVANSLKYADVDVTCAADYVYGQIPDCPPVFSSRSDIVNNVKASLSIPYHEGMILTGDQFFCNKDRVDQLLNDYFKNDSVMCFDMESTALAQASWFYGIDYLAIRAISDVIGHNAQFDEYLSNLDRACLNSNLFIIEVLKNI